MFWDGERWIDERAASAPQPRTHRGRRGFRYWLAAVPAIFLVSTALIPPLAVQATAPTIVVIGIAVPGATLPTTGTGFGARTGLQLQWDGSQTGMPAVRTSDQGEMAATIVVPAAATAGRHLLAATSNHAHGRASGSDVLATASIVVSVPAPATPSPAGTPVSTPVAAATALAITAVGASKITQTQGTITWTVSAPATGQVEYGTTAAYGSFSAPEDSLRYTTHVQRLSNLVAGTVYHYRTHSTDAAGRSAYSGDHTFVTLAAATTTPTATPGTTVTPAPTPTATAVPTPVPSRPATSSPPPSSTASPSASATPATGGSIYGSGIAIDTKNNFIVGGSALARLSHRFRASTTSPLLKIRWAQRGGVGYAAGTGGSLRISVQADVNGLPSGVPLASLTYRPDWPGGTWAPFEEQAFAAPATLVEGRLYDIVFENTDGSPATNYISVNDLLVYNYAYVPRQPALSDDYAVLYARNDAYGGAWHLMPRDTADMDLTYADGTHDGMGYIEAMAAQAGYVTGTQMVREHFTVTGGARVVTSVAVRVMRSSGTGSNPLVLRLETGAGAEIESASIPYSSVVTGTVGDTSGGNWVTATFRTPHVLAAGSTYNLRLSTGSGVTYAVVPIREGTDSGVQSAVGFRSYRFTDGDGQKTLNGSTWTNLYAWSPVDLQFYFR